MSMEIDGLTRAGDGEASDDLKCGVSAATIVGWFSVGMAVAALGVLVGREIFSRYKFKKRTPYDFYSNAGEHYSNSGEQQAGEFAVGI